MRSTISIRMAVGMMLVGCLLMTGAAHANEADAQTFFAEGRRLRKAGQCESAIEQFERATRAYPEGLGSLRNIAECQEQLGRFASARRSWWNLRRQVLKLQNPKYDGWDRHAEEAHARLAPRVSRLVVRLVGPGASTATARVDGRPIPAKLLGVELERDAGVHAVEAVRGDRVLDTKSIRVAEAERREVTLHVPAPTEPLRPVAPHAPDEPPPDEPSPDEPSAGMLIASGVTAGIGSASLVGLFVSLGVRSAAVRELERVCGPEWETRPCPPAAEDPASRGRTASLLVNVFAATAGAAAVAGVTLLILDVSGDEQPDADVGLAPTAGGAAFDVSWRF